MLSWLIKRTVADTVREELPKQLRRVVPEVIAEFFQEADDSVVPSTRQMFLYAIDAELQAKCGMGGDKGLLQAQEFLADLERETAPWGDKDYAWDLRAIREYLAEIMEDR